MAKSRQVYLDSSRRPIYCLLFLLPFIVGYEIGAAYEHRSLLAEQMLRDFLTLRGRAVNYLSGLFVLAVMIAWQFASRQPWRVQPKILGTMFLEAAVLTLPLFLLHAVLPRSLSQPPTAGSAISVCHGSVSRDAPLPAEPSAGSEATRLTEPLQTGSPQLDSLRADGGDERPAARRLLRDVVISLGAGPYEELLFRFFLMELLLWCLHAFGVDARTAIIPAVLISATLFAGYHYLPAAAERFTWGSFLFRTGAGVYFSLVFVNRGYGIAAGCHTFYDILVDVARGW